MAKKRVVVLASGSGSNFQAIIDFAQKDASFEIVGLIVNVPEVKAIERAKAANIASKLINHKEYAGRSEFEVALHEALLDFNAELVVCAGFMRILQPDFVNKWEGKMINIHPSLLPKYKGLHTHQRAIDAGDKNAGCTVHFVNAGVDEGAIIGQAEVEIIDGDDAEKLAARVITKEHILYPICVEAVAAEKIILKNGVCLIDNKPNIIHA
jgi:phosphoribosylglycinamide formyltransferase-1